MSFNLLLDERFHVAGDFLVEKGLTDLVDDLAGGGGADIGKIEAFFQLFEEGPIRLCLRSRKSWPMPVKTSRVLRRPFLIRCRIPPRTMSTPSAGGSSVGANSSSSAAGDAVADPTAQAAEGSGPWQSLPPK